MKSNQFPDWSKMFSDEWKLTFRLTKRCLVYGWAAKSVPVITSKKNRA